MKLSKKDQNLLLMVGGILLIIITYFFAYTKLLDKTDVIKNENANLQGAISKLEELQDNQDFYETETERFIQENIAIQNTYPSAVMNADKILFAKTLEDQYDLYVTYVGIQMPENVEVEYPVPELLSVNDQLNGNAAPMGESNPNGLYLFRHGVELNYEAGYTDMKKALQFILDDSKQKTIHSVALSYNEESGVLTGSMSASMYSMSGTQAAYNRPDFTGIKVGTDDIFKTFEDLMQNKSDEDTEE